MATRPAGFRAGFRKCACSLCGTAVKIPARFCEGCLVYCHTIMSAANSLDDICGADFTNIDWSPDTVRSQTVEHGGGFAAVAAFETDEGFYEETDGGDGDAMGQGRAAEGDPTESERMSMAAEAFAEAYTAGEADDADEVDADEEEESDGGSGSNGNGGGSDDPPFIYVVTRRAFNLTDDGMRRGVVGTATGLAIFKDLKSARKFARPLRANHLRNKYRCKKIELS